MDMMNEYKRDLREKLETLGTVVSETGHQFLVEVDAPPDEAYRRVVTLMPSATDIKVTPQGEASRVQVQFAGVSTLNE